MTASENYQSAYGIVLALSFAVPGQTGDESNHDQLLSQERKKIKGKPSDNCIIRPWYTEGEYDFRGRIDSIGCIHSPYIWLSGGIRAPVTGTANSPNKSKSRKGESPNELWVTARHIMTVRRSKRLNPRHLTPRGERYARRASKALDEEEIRCSRKTLKHKAHAVQSARVLRTNSLVPIGAPLPQLHHIAHRNDEVPNKRHTAGLPTWQQTMVELAKGRHAVNPWI
ncbi:hypothetical protein B0H13DRAFT_1887379 [Mycena leptocephala]|nr:hypothetical protein B0H13DRAFT_1887379 [Mycena leptocephala]